MSGIFHNNINMYAGCVSWFLAASSFIIVIKILLIL